jgi:segregation and condensation protein B
MARQFPTPHQLNAARGCVGKSGLESLWRPRGASDQNTNQSTSKAGPHTRRARRPSPDAKVVSEPEAHEPALCQLERPGPDVHGPGDRPEVDRPDGDGPEVLDTRIPEPEIGDLTPAPEIDDSGNPEPDVPEPEVPLPEIPEPELPLPKAPEPKEPEPELPRLV